MQQIFAWIFLLVQAEAAEPVKSLSFEKEEFSFSTDYSEAIKEFDLPFTNHTDKPVNVLKVETSCSCMKVSVLEPRVEPGATGRVHCVFNVPNSTEPVEKLVIMQTDAAGGGMHITRVRIEMPSILTLTPERLAWTVRTAADEKILRIQVAEAAPPVNITKVECSGNTFEWSLKAIREGREFELRVRPKTTEKVTLGIFQIQSTSQVERQKKRRFHAVVEAAKTLPH